MAEDYGWVFVDNIPLLYDKKRVARQLQVETWLDLTQLVKELKIEQISPRSSVGTPPAGYIV